MLDTLLPLAGESRPAAQAQFRGLLMRSGAEVQSKRLSRQTLNKGILMMLLVLRIAWSCLKLHAILKQRLAGWRRGIVTAVSPLSGVGPKVGIKNPMGRRGFVKLDLTACMIIKVNFAGML